ncbi:MAG: DUF1343 domain-containing protein [Acidobacteria bacterium]|nr:DUF1343 domain-containing protein [Acidobacteriota bacterium]
MKRVVAVLFAVLLTLPAFAAEWKGSANLDRIVEDAIKARTIPGAVLLIGRGDVILHEAAYGSKRLIPNREPMDVDTVFDAASLTKVAATAPAVMMLVEEGRLRLDDRVRTFLPDFAGGDITIRQLLTHTSGLRPDVDLEPVWSGYETGIAKALREKPTAEPGTRFIYSDINFILLAEIVHQVSGLPIDEFAAQRIFEPLSMTDSTYLPDPVLRVRIAPTEQLSDGTILHGVVHDPTTRFMGGVAGHAGLFTTARDLGRFAQAMLRGGERGSRRILSPLSVAQMTTRQSPPDLPSRGLGWDIDSPYASPRGDLLPIGSYGHTGYTGCSVWIDPGTRLWIVLMTNRVHPTTRTSVVSLRSRIASAAAAALDDLAFDAAREAVEGRAVAIPAVPAIETGLDVLVAENFERLAGKRIGLITNHTGVDRLSRRNVDLFAARTDVQLVRVFSPEHGLTGQLDEELIADAVDPTTGTPVVSLYRPDQRRPKQEMLADLDALVFDIQDVGARFYTYTTTMAYAIEEAAKAGIPIYILDRPNPITGTRVEGPLLDAQHHSFIGYMDLPVRHGMTVGELALFFNSMKRVGADVRVVPMRGWRRAMWFDETGLPWVNPSPNIRSLDQAILYPGIALLEGLRNYSVGRGLDEPFEFIGADWIDGKQLAEKLNQRGLAGVRFHPEVRTPASSNFAGKSIEGVGMTIFDREALGSLRMGLELASILGELYPAHLDFKQTGLLIGDSQSIEQLSASVPVETIWRRWQRLAADFQAERKPYLLYD